MKNPDQPFDYFEELTRRIQDIRTSERRFYQKITDIYATSIDYDPHTGGQHPFLQNGSEQGALGDYRPDRRMARTFRRDFVEDKGGSHSSRYYQDIAVERVMLAISEKRQSPMP